MKTVAAQPTDGIYVDGESGTPHYYISIRHPDNSTLAGAVSFLAQDGQTSPVFNFSGSEQGGAATVEPDNGGGPISVTYGDDQLQLGECTQYLEFVLSLADCTFNLSPTGLA